MADPTTIPASYLQFRSLVTQRPAHRRKSWASGDPVSAPEAPIEEGLGPFIYENTTSPKTFSLETVFGWKFVPAQETQEETRQDWICSVEMLRPRGSANLLSRAHCKFRSTISWITISSSFLYDADPGGA